MDQRPKPKDPAKPAEPSDQKGIVKPGAGEDPTRALDVRATMALRGAEAERMREATQAMPIEPPAEAEPTVALHIHPAPDRVVPEPTPSRDGASTQKVRQEDIAWVAGEQPDEPGLAGPEVASVDPTSRVRVRLSDLTRIVQDREASQLPPVEASQTTMVPIPAAEPTPDDSGATTRLGRQEMDQILAQGEAGTSLVPVVQVAEQTLILRPEPGASRTELMQLLLPPLPEPARGPSEATLVLKAEAGTVPIAKPVPVPETPTCELPLVTAAPAADPVVEAQADAGTAPIQRPATILETPTRELPQVKAGQDGVMDPGEKKSAGTPTEAGASTLHLSRSDLHLEPAPATMLMPKVEAVPEPETAPVAEPVTETVPASSTVLMPKVEAVPQPAASTLHLSRSDLHLEPAPATMLMPKVEAAPGTVPVTASEPVPSTLLMPMVEAAPGAAPVTAAKSVPSTVLIPKIEPAPAASTALMQKVEPAPAPLGEVGPGGTVPVQRTGSSTGSNPEVASRPDARFPEAPGVSGGTLQAQRPLLPVAPPGGTVPVARPPQPLPTAHAGATPILPPPIPDPVPPTASPRAAEPPLVEVYATRHMPLQAAPAAAPGPATAPAGVPPAKGAGKLWVALVGGVSLVGLGLLAWLRPDLIGLGGSGRPSFASSGAPRDVPPALKATKDKADAGDAAAMRYLGTCYANGLGVPRDVEAAKHWFRKAAEAGSQSAREELANLQR